MNSSIYYLEVQKRSPVLDKELKERYLLDIFPYIFSYIRLFGAKNVDKAAVPIIEYAYLLGLKKY